MEKRSAQESDQEAVKSKKSKQTSFCKWSLFFHCTISMEMILDDEWYIIEEESIKVAVKTKTDNENAWWPNKV